MMSRYAIGLSLWWCLAPMAWGERAHVAVAANFAPVMEILAPRFEAATGHRLLISYGSTGTLYAQIRNGAPFEVMLSADEQRPRRLEQAGLGVPGSRFTYALGRLVLWSREPGWVQDAAALAGDYRYLAIANPRIAPYGVAARQVLEKLGLWQALGERIVEGESVTQAYQFIASGNAELGFVALSQIQGRRGSYWPVGEDLYDPIAQQALLLVRGADNLAARALLDYLQGQEGRSLIQAAGYRLPAAGEWTAACADSGGQPSRVAIGRLFSAAGDG